jgi:hypothetical protein
MFVTLTVEVDPDSDPLCGWIAGAEIGPAHAESAFGNSDSVVTAGQTFTGWTEFSLAVEASVAQVRMARRAPPPRASPKGSSGTSSPG